MAEEMQQLNEVNESVCNKAQQIRTFGGQQEDRDPFTRSKPKAQHQINPIWKNVSTHQDEGIPEEGSPILVHVKTKEGGPVLTNLFQSEVIGEIIKGCVQKYPTSVNVFNEYEVVITMPNEMIADIVAKDLESMEQWGSMHSSIHCTIVSKNRFRPMLEEKCETSPKVSTNVPIDKLVEKIMNNIMTQVDEKIRAISESSLPRVSNQSFAADKVIGNYGAVPMVNSQNSLGGEGPIWFIAPENFIL